VAAYVEDAAHFPGGHADALCLPESEADVAAALQQPIRVLPIGAQSSLTGGATPFGEVVLSLRKMTGPPVVGPQSVRVPAGVTLDELRVALAAHGLRYPPVPTFTGASVGGIVSTNAAGATAFKYGTTRDWVRGLTVVLPGGDVLDLVRGEATAHDDGFFELDLARGRVHVPIPTYHMPEVPKLSAGYYAQSGMDLVDLFIGAEGTLGVITEATLRVVPAQRPSCLAFIVFDNLRSAWSVAARLREAALQTRASGDERGLDVAAIEHMDTRCLSLLREQEEDRRCGVILPSAAAMALLVTIELPGGTSDADVYDQIGGAEEGADGPIARFSTLLAEYDALAHTDFAPPGDAARAAQLLAIREAVPAAVNRRIGLARQRIDARIDKTAADVIVPFEELEGFIAFCNNEISRRGLDGAIWGHTCDGSIHPNVIPRSFDEVARGRDAMLAIGREAMRLGGAPLAEHGVGRNLTKQQLLRELYGERGIGEMRRVKTAIDPGGKLAPGVIFPSR
jgi:D-lactate dehydrogenase (cytochrome)